MKVEAAESGEIVISDLTPEEYSEFLKMPVWFREELFQGVALLYASQRGKPLDKVME